MNKKKLSKNNLDEVSGGMQINSVMPHPSIPLGGLDIEPASRGLDVKDEPVFLTSSSLSTEGDLDACSDAAPTRDDGLGRLVKEAFDIPAPPMPVFE